MDTSVPEREDANPSPLGEEPKNTERILKPRFTPKEASAVRRAAEFEGVAIGTWARSVIRDVVEGRRSGVLAYTRHEPSSETTRRVPFRLRLTPEEDRDLTEKQNGLPRALWCRLILCEVAYTVAPEKPAGPEERVDEAAGV